MTSLAQIKYENGPFWVCTHKDGHFEVYKSDVTHSVRVAVIGWKGESGLKRAIAECDKRAGTLLT